MSTSAVANLSLWGISDLTLHDVRATVVDSLGAVLYVQSSHSDKVVRMDPSLPRYFGNEGFWYFGTATASRAILSWSDEERAKPRIVFVNDAPTALNSYGIQAFPFANLSVDTLLSFAASCEPTVLQARPSKSDAVTQALADIRGQTLFQSVHALFYRIPSKDARKAAQAAVIKYLCGKGALPVGLPAKMTEALTGPRAQVLRATMKQALREDLEPFLASRPDLDEFEIRYLATSFRSLKKESKS